MPERSVSEGIKAFKLFLNPRLHEILEPYTAKSGIPFEGELLDRIEGRHPSPALLNRAPDSVQLFLHVISPIFTVECRALIQENFWHFNAMINDTGRISDAFISHETTKEWVKEILRGIIYTIWYPNGFKAKMTGKLILHSLFIIRVELTFISETVNSV